MKFIRWEITQEESYCSIKSQRVSLSF